MPRKNTSTKRTSRYNNECSSKGIAKNFLKIRKDAEVKKIISTGSVMGDLILTKIPVIGKGMRYINTGSAAGANIAHGINAYRESCGNRKKK